jgi:hypothetical protein
VRAAPRSPQQRQRRWLILNYARDKLGTVCSWNLASLLALRLSLQFCSLSSAMPIMTALKHIFCVERHRSAGIDLASPAARFAPWDRRGALGV